MRILAIDSGNSRIKWALAESRDEWLRQGATTQGDDTPLLEAFAELPRPDRIIASNVADETAGRRLEKICLDLWDRRPDFITAQARQCGVRNGYEHPAQLGSDRWAMLIAAWRHERAACLVASCGTAITVDALSHDGEFLGGLILPGLKLMRESLVTGTALGGKPEIHAQGTWREFPRNTADAMRSGVINAAVGAIHAQYARLDAPTRCILSGGAAHELQPWLDLPTRLMDDGVLRGLIEIAREGMD